MLNKEEFLNKIGKSDIAIKLYNQINMALEYGITVNSEYFVTPNIWKKLPQKFDNIKISLLGYDRKQICFHLVEEEPIFDYEVLKISINNKFKKYTHKDFLGSIMSLNIKREMIGDLFVESDNVCYVFVTKSILEYLLNNLKEIGKNEIKIEISKKRQFEYTFKDVNILLTSNRLDNFVAAITNMSRNKAIEYIESSNVLLNYETCTKRNKIFLEDDIITIKKIGKFKVFNQNGISKKNKERWIVKKYD